MKLGIIAGYSPSTMSVPIDRALRILAEELL